MFTIYLDMDGVLADFDSAYVGRFGERPSSKARDEKEFRKNWTDFVMEKHFEKLGWFPGAQDLLAYVEKLREDPNVRVEILTSTGGEKYHNEVGQQKIKWLDDHNIPYTANCVPGRKHKGDYADKWSVLIDDTWDCIERFEKKGGYGIHHKNFSDTLPKLKSFYLQYLASQV